MLENLRKYRVILASNSPRRRDLLKGLDIDFEVCDIPHVEESYPEGINVEDIPGYIAFGKASAYQMSAEGDELVITADTMVIVGNDILGKPKDDEDACRMLRLLSGKTHQVITGVCVMTRDRIRRFSVSTNVTFSELSEEDINYYVSHYHPLDKAGAYGIQEWIGYVGVTGLQGSYFNVMGLPVQRLYQELSLF